MSIVRGQHVGFGLDLGRGFDPQRLAEHARLADRLGYDLLSISDHLHSDEPRYEPWTALTWVAAATERIGVLPNVLGLPYRSPAVTAKAAEILDRLSGGRLVLGLGVGGYDHEFAAFGLPVRAPGAKVGALDEAVQVIRKLWAEESASFDGTYFQLNAARIEPRPANGIPIWLGTYGPRSLRITGARADGWLPSMPRLELPQAVAMREVVRSSALAAGRDPDEITYAANVVVGFDSTKRPTNRLVIGGGDAIAEQLLAIVRAGFTFLQISGIDQPELMERFATEVIPLVRRELVG